MNSSQGYFTATTSYTSDSNIYFRKKAHVEARELMRAGMHETALCKIELTKRSNGCNISLLSDQAICHYYLGQQMECDQALEEIKRLLNDRTIFIQEEQRINSELLMAKLLEEKSRLCEAIRIYRKLLSRSQTKNSGENWRSAAAQLLRIGSQYGLDLNRAIFHRALTELRISPKDHVDSVDIQHSLILAEARLVGAASACRRFKNFSETNLNLGKAEISLIIFDLAEILLRSPKKLAATEIAMIREILSKAQPSDLYEKILHSLLLQRAPAAVIAAINSQEFSQKLSSACCIRILSLASQAAFLPMDTQVECMRRLSIHLQSLTTQDRPIWKRIYFPSQIAAKPVFSVTLSRKEHSFFVNGKEIIFGRKVILLRLLSAFFPQNSRRTDYLLKALWREKPSPAHLQRLRTLTGRLNALVLAQTGIPDLLNYSNLKISVQAEQILHK